MLRWFYAHFRTILCVSDSGDSVTCHSWPRIPATSLILVLGRREYAAVLHYPQMVRDCVCMVCCGSECVCMFACGMLCEWVRVCSVCICVWTEWTWSVHYVGISNHSVLYTSVHTHTHIIWGWRTDVAKSELQNEYKLKEALLKQNLEV